MNIYEANQVNPSAYYKHSESGTIILGFPSHLDPAKISGSVVKPADPPFTEGSKTWSLGCEGPFMTSDFEKIEVVITEIGSDSGAKITFSND